MRLCDRLLEFRAELSEQAFATLGELRPNSLSRLSPDGRVRCKEDLGFHLDFLAASLAAGSDAVLNDYLRWLRVLFERQSVSVEDVEASMRALAFAAEKRLGREEALPLSELVERAMFIYGRLNPADNPYLAEARDLSPRAGGFLAAIMEGRRDLAVSLTRSALDGAASIRELYLEVFEPVQRELGRLWHRGLLSVAREHAATACTQYAMALCYPALFASSGAKRPKAKVLVACAQGELHEIGARMVCDVLETEGFRTRYLGANVPVASLVAEVLEYKPDLLALSATIAPRILTLERSVQALRERTELAGLPIMMGGLPFSLEPGLAERLGANGSAPDCLGALNLAERLLSGGEGAKR